MADSLSPAPASPDSLAAQLSGRMRHMAALSRAGDLDAAEQGLGEIVVEARAAGLSGLVGQGLYRLSFIHDLRGDYYTSTAELKEALKIAAAGGHFDLAAACHFSLGRQLMLRGRLREAEDALDAALADARRSGSDERQGDVYALHARCCLWLGRLPDALSYVREATGLLESSGSPALLHTLGLGASVARQLGLVDDEARFMERARALSGLSSYAKVMSETAALSVLDQLALGHIAQGQQRLGEAEALLGGGKPGLHLLLARAKCMELRGSLEETYVVYMEAQSLAQKRQSRYEIAWIRLERAPGLIALGAMEQAQALLTDAELAFEHFSAQIHLGCCYCGWVRYFLTAGNRTAAQAALVQAKAQATRLGDAAGLQLAAGLRWSEQAIAGGPLVNADAAAPDAPPPLLHPASTLQ